MFCLLTLSESPSRFRGGSGGRTFRAGSAESVHLRRRIASVFPSEFRDGAVGSECLRHFAGGSFDADDSAAVLSRYKSIAWGIRPSARIRTSKRSF